MAREKKLERIKKSISSEINIINLYFSKPQRKYLQRRPGNRVNSARRETDSNACAGAANQAHNIDVVAQAAYVKHQPACIRKEAPLRQGSFKRQIVSIIESQKRREIVSAIKDSIIIEIAGVLYHIRTRLNGKGRRRKAVKLFVGRPENQSTRKSGPA